MVDGATDGLTLPQRARLGRRRRSKAAGPNVFSYRFRTWYAPLAKALDDATGELLTKRINPAQWAERVQKAADAVAKDSSVVKKHQRWVMAPCGTASTGSWPGR